MVLGGCIVEGDYQADAGGAAGPRSFCFQRQRSPECLKVKRVLVMPQLVLSCNVHGSSFGEKSCQDFNCSDEQDYGSWAQPDIADSL